MTIKIKAGDEILLTGVLAHVVSIGHDDIADRPLLNLYGNEPEFSYFTGWATSVEVYSKRTGRFRRVDGDISYRYVGYEKCCQCQAAKTLDSDAYCEDCLNSMIAQVERLAEGR